MFEPKQCGSLVGNFLMPFINKYFGVIFFGKLLFLPSLVSLHIIRSMKKLLLGMLLLVATQLIATTHTITVKNFGFEPSSLNVEVGDLIEWKWESGSHTTTSKTIPSGAASWDSPMTSSSASYSYTITKVGTYNYVCTPHQSGGMVASITASAKTLSVDLENINQPEIFPNPFQNQIIVNNAEFTRYQFFSVTGDLQKEEILVGNTIITSDLDKGVYFLVLFKDEEQEQAIRVIKK